MSRRLPPESQGRNGQNPRSLTEWKLRITAFSGNFFSRLRQSSLGGMPETLEMAESGGSPGSWEKPKG